MTLLMTDFMAEHGRPPLLGKDDIPPWRYRGWLLFYVQECHAHPSVPFPDRWGYLATLHAGRDPGPIEPVRYERSSAVAKSIAKLIEGLMERHGYGWGGFRRFLDFLSYGLGTSDVEADLKDGEAEYLYRNMKVHEWLASPYDYLGDYICEMRGTGWNPNAFFPTPHHLVECMVAMTFVEPGDNRFKSALDCCCGTGRMLMHAGNHVLYLAGQDIDPTMVQITKLHGALYVPWMVCPPPQSWRDSAAATITVPPPPPPRRAKSAA